VAPRIARKGFSGLFLDNVDMVETHPRQRRGMYRLVRGLARDQHLRHRVLFTQNGDSMTSPLVPVLDGWNREDVTWTYDFDRRRYVPVAPADSAAAQAVRTACAAGALPFVSDIGLRRISPHPPGCG
jgi:polysaccharide biosynthesis protein PelA